MTKRRWLGIGIAVVLGSCHTDSQDVGVERRGGALTASKTLGQALTNKVVEPPNASGGLIAAATTGEAGVGDDGTASYRIPIWTPDGIAGLKPALAIEYNSEGGTGLLGPRWRLAGLSTIVRCPQTLAQDGIERPIDYRGDVFCLDGVRLVRISGTANQTGDFRTERDPFARIQVTAADGSTGALSFQVNQSDGLIFYYGSSSGSRLQGNPQLFPTGSLTGGIYAYYLDKVQDRYGNTIQIAYQNQSSGLSNVQELAPLTITWGPTALRSVRFGYQTFPASGGQFPRYVRSKSGMGIISAQYLSTISLYGPDGQTYAPDKIHLAPVLLKQYTLGYDGVLGTPTVTGEHLLTSVKECDGANVCKRPTTMSWEPGTNPYLTSGYARTPMIVPASTDIYNANLKCFPGSGNPCRDYRRLIVADLNNDGRDDLVYPTFVPGSPSNISWSARTTLAGGAQLDNPVSLGADQTASGFLPYPGDLIFADLNLDGYPDMLFPNGQLSASAPQTISFNGYWSALNSTTGNLISFGARNSFEGSAVTHSAPHVAIGDVDGDGLPEVVRPQSVNGQTSLWAADISASGVTVRTMPGMYPSTTNGFSLIDLDGDGAAEVLRDVWQGCPPSSQPCNNAIVTSSTMSGGTLIPPTSPGNPPSAVRWLLDLNGDGLLDIAYVNVSDPATILTKINTGKGFVDGAATTIPPVASWAQVGTAWIEGGESGARVIDFNLDGRQDLLLVDADNGRRSQAAILLSDGSGTFNYQQTAIPIGDWADSPAFVSHTGRHNYSTTVVADLNGDALPDIVQMEAGVLVAYMRAGKAPDMVTSIAEGTGRTISFGYSPLSDKSVYSSDPSTCAPDPQHLACLVHGRWLTQSLTISGAESSTTSVSQSQTFSYQNGLIDRNGRGFLGFQTRVIKGLASLQTVVTYGNLTVRTPLGNGYIYPEAFAPTSTSSWVSTPQGPNSLHNTVKGIARNFLTSAAPGTIYMSHTLANEYSQDCPPATGSTPACSGSPRVLTYVWHEVTNDSYGNATYDSTSFYDGASNWLRTDTSIITYSGADTTNWLVHMLSQVQTTSHTASGESVTRTTNYTPNTTTGLIKSIEIEPTGDATTHLIRTFVPDGSGRLQSVSDQSVATGETRTTSFMYEDADGVYATTTTYPATPTATLSTRTWRHPGYGFVVEEDDPNRLAGVRTYDTFGRVQSETGVSGASVGFTYLDSEVPATVGGVDLRVTPENSPTRQFSVHLDSFGRETVRWGVPIDGAQILTFGTTYDGMGRVVQKTVVSAASTVTTLNTESFTWDDMSRLLSDCKTTSYYVYGTPVVGCKSNTYDGLSVTASDESGRTVTHIADPLGRPSIQRAVIGNPAGGTQTSNATFTYGPFDVLEHETAADGTGKIENKTDAAYDVLGRPVSVTRSLPGTRGTTYNAFSDVVATYKLVNGSHYEEVTYVPDALGRVTSMSGTGIARTFSWDASAGSPAGTTDPYAIGKLVDVVNNAFGLNNDSKVHLTYGSNGLPATKQWTVKPSSTVTLTGTAQWTYDGQGRVDTLTYPVLNGWATPLKVQYVYDSYTGTPRSLLDITSGGPASYTMWSANARNQLGQITNESLAPPGPPPASGSFTRTSSYYLQDGRLNTATLVGGGSPVNASLTYGYQADGLPAAVSASLGTTVKYQSAFDYDNLGRLTSWTPTIGAPTVSYGYDSDGKLLSRSWSGESAAYSFNPSADPAYGTVNTVKITRGAQVTTDNYPADLWGRMVTPAMNATYSALDEVSWLAENATGLGHAIIRDGFGRRLVSTTGNPATAGSTVSYVATLDDLFELSYSYGTNTYEERCRLRADGKLIGDAVRTTNGGTRTATFYLADAVGSVVAEGTSSTGTVSTRTQRDPFGNLITDPINPYLPTDTTGANPDGTSRLAYGGHERDAGWGVVDMGARLYSPRLGRFLSADSMIGRPLDRRAYNPYAYAMNAPTAMLDPDGRCSTMPDGADPCPGPVVGGNPLAMLDWLYHHPGPASDLLSPLTLGELDFIYEHRHEIAHEIKDFINNDLAPDAENAGSALESIGKTIGGAIKSAWCTVFCISGGGPTNLTIPLGNIAVAASSSPGGQGSPNPGRGSGSTDGNIDPRIRLLRSQEFDGSCVAACVRNAIAIATQKGIPEAQIRGEMQAQSKKPIDWQGAGVPMIRATPVLRAHGVAANEIYEGVDTISDLVRLSKKSVLMVGGVVPGGFHAMILLGTRPDGKGGRSFEVIDPSATKAGGFGVPTYPRWMSQPDFEGFWSPDTIVIELWPRP